MCPQISSTFKNKSRFGSLDKSLDVAVNSTHLPSIDTSVKARLEKQARDTAFINQRVARRAQRDDYTHAEIKTVLAPKEAHHDKHLRGLELLERFPPGIHKTISMRDEHIATLPEDMSFMHHITKVDVAGNNIQKLSQGLMTLPDLTDLDASNNYIHHVMPNTSPQVPFVPQPGKP